jgi:hypothetical protein
MSKNFVSSFALSCLVAVALPALAQNATNTPGTTNYTLVTITATDASASEAGGTGQFRVARGDRTNGALTVWLQIAGTATGGSDYQTISNIVLIPDGARALEIPVVPIDDMLVEGTESVIVRVIPSPLASPVPTYLVGSPSSATVSIADNDTPPPTNRFPAVALVQPAAGSTFPAGANISLLAQAYDPDGSVVSVEFFADNLSLGLGTRAANSPGTISSNLWSLIWSNALAGEHTLAAKATDNQGAMTLSAGVRILVGSNTPPPPPSNRAPEVRLILPLDGSQYAAPATIGFAADAVDPDGQVASVDFLANGIVIGRGVRSTTGANWQTNQWYFSWTNVSQGEYLCTAKATDNLGAMGVSAPVHVRAGTNTPPPPPTNTEPVVVSITATDPHASEGLVMWASNVVVGVNNDPGRTNMPGTPSIIGTNTATFTVRRSGPTNASLRVYYAIGGTASNGADYVTLPGVVTIPAGRRSAEIRVVPIDDTIPEHLETVALRLMLPPLPLDPADSPYTIGRPGDAAAFIVDNDTPPPPPRVLPGGMFHVCDRITNGCFRVEVTTNLVNWEIICTNNVADGMARHIDCDGTNHLRRFFRLTPVPCPVAEP